MKSSTALATLAASALLFAASAVSAGPAPAASSALEAAVKTAMKAPDDSFRDDFVREVWLKTMSARLAGIIPDAAKRRKLLLAVHAEATHAGVPPALVLAIINVESNFDPWAVSSAGAQGLMQIMPFWLEEAGQPGDNLFDPRTNLRLGCTILAYYLKRADGDIALALQNYYGNRYGNGYSQRVLRFLATRWYWKD
ncbi:MAG: lytic transglycosylase domain-containing protein [Gammaproteobacteria bacterium]|nr:lytic transglycosylase domain-containing protein [Gammaproteobacteria bacterium]